MWKGVLLLVFLPFSSFAQVKIDSNAKFPISIHESSQLFESETATYSIEEIIKNEGSLSFLGDLKKNTRIGFTVNEHWLKFELVNDSNDELNLFFETARPTFDQVILYEVFDGQVISKVVNGDLIPFASRPFPHQKIIFPISLKKGEHKTFYTQYNGDGQWTPLRLKIHNIASLTDQSEIELITFGIFFGFILISVIILAILFFGFSKRIFILFSFYILALGLWHANMEGYFFQYFTKEPSFFSNRSVLIFACLSALGLARYLQIFFQVKDFSRRLNFLYSFFIVGIITILTGVFFLDEYRPLYYLILNGSAFSILILVSITAIYSYFSKFRMDNFAILAISSAIIGFTVNLIANLSGAEYSFLTSNMAKFGIIGEIIFLSISMSKQIRLLQLDKEKLSLLVLKKSQEANQIKSFLLSNISHELQTPLNAILGLSQAIYEETNDSKTKDTIGIIKYSSLNLLNAIHDLLDFTKIEKQELKLDQVEFDLSKIILSLKEKVEIQAKSSGLAFTVEEINPIKNKLIGDPIRIEKIIENILQNALKFTSKGYVKLTVKANELSDDTIALQIDIADSGIGIDKEKIDSFFDSFTQDRVDDKRKFGGFGLGLFISKSLTELHGGTISIQSTVGLGTTVSVQLTLAKGKKILDYDPLFSLANDPDILIGIHALIAEDNLINQTVIKAILRKFEGLSFEFVIDGSEALMALKKKEFDLILMDLQMPEMDGYEATEEIRSGNSGINSNEIPIIAVTADTTEKAKTRAAAVGMNNFISKPIDPDTLKNVIIKTLFLKKIIHH
jgi:signal transduction histidine kinase/ActR/RegA family two-component response regulator